MTGLAKTTNPIEIGEIQTFLHISSIGVTRPRIAIARFKGADTRVYAKQLDARKVAAEIFGAMLARMAGLSSTVPGLAVDPSSGEWYYTSREVAALPFSRRFMLNSMPAGDQKTAALTHALKWLVGRDDFPTLVAYDEWINNRDRNIDNLLIHGQSFTVIDHEQSFNCHDTTRADSNKMVDAARIVADLPHQIQIKSSATGRSLTFSASWIQMVFESICDTPGEPCAGQVDIKEWLTPRTSRLPMLIDQRMPVGQRVLGDE